MLENHINSHQKSELKRSLKKLNRLLNRQKRLLKRPKDDRINYNMRIKNTQRRIGILKKTAWNSEAHPGRCQTGRHQHKCCRPRCYEPGCCKNRRCSIGCGQPGRCQPRRCPTGHCQLGGCQTGRCQPGLDQSCIRIHTLEFPASTRLLDSRENARKLLNYRKNYLLSISSSEGHFLGTE